MYLVDNMKLIELLQLDQKLKDFFELHKKLLYLSYLSEEKLWEVFEDTI